MSKDKIADIKEALERAEGGLWVPQDDCPNCRGKGYILHDTEAGREYDECHCLIPENRTFNANAPEWLTYLLSELDRKDSTINELNGEVERLTQRNRGGNQMKQRQRGFERINMNAILPRRATMYSAGYDISACIAEPIIIQPGEMTVIETGVTAYMLPDEELQIRPRSGLGLKHQITIQNTPATIDSDYYPRPFKVLLRNEGDKPFVVNPGDRVAQAVFAKYLITDDDDPIEDDRKGGFGSTGM